MVAATIRSAIVVQLQLYVIFATDGRHLGSLPGGSQFQVRLRMLIGSLIGATIGHRQHGPFCGRVLSRVVIPLCYFSPLIGMALGCFIM